MPKPSNETALDHLRHRWATENYGDGVGTTDSPGTSGHDQKDEGEDQNQGLSEVAAPRPADTYAKRDSLERRVRERGADNGDDADLTEANAPPPAEEESSPSEHHITTPQRDTLEEEEARFRKEEKAKSTTEPLRPVTELYTVSWLIFFSFLGTLARLGVEAITTYPNSPFPSRVLWANLGGSFFMGFLAEDRRLFRQEWGNKSSFDPSKHGTVKKTIPLYIGLATGFCGCFTSFSSFMRDSFLALTNDLVPPSPTTPYALTSTISPRNGGFSFLALLAILIVHPAISLSALIVGAHFALLLQPVTPILPFQFTRRILDPLAIPLAFGSWLGAILLAIFPPAIAWRSRAVFPLIFAPLGCLARFYISKYLNPRISSFPLGTFVANILGTAILGMAWDLQHSGRIGSAPGGDVTSCAVLQGVMEGFCGCLTTVSTWVAELKGLRTGHAWVYGGCSVVVGLGVMVVIMGGMGWTVGFGETLCG